MGNVSASGLPSEDQVTAWATAVYLALEDGFINTIAEGLVPMETYLTISAAIMANMTQAVEKGFAKVRTACLVDCDYVSIRACT